jgi:hypothetical protein
LNFCHPATAIVGLAKLIDAAALIEIEADAIVTYCRDP